MTDRRSNDTTRQAKLDLLHRMNDEYKAVTGDSLYMYANAPGSDDGNSTEYFRFQGDHTEPGVDRALIYMQQRLTAAGGAQYL